MNPYSAPLPDAPPAPQPSRHPSPLAVTAAYLPAALLLGALTLLLDALRYICSSPPPRPIPVELVTLAAAALGLALPSLGFRLLQPDSVLGRAATGGVGFLAATFLGNVLSDLDLDGWEHLRERLVDAGYVTISFGGPLALASIVFLEVGLAVSRWRARQRAAAQPGPA